MGFDFNKLKEKAKVTAKAVGDKTSTTVETVKIKSKISSEKTAINDAKKQLGDIIWAQYEDGAVLDENLQEICDAIRMHLSNIDQYEKDIEALKTKETGNEADVEADSDTETTSSVEAEVCEECECCSSEEVVSEVFTETEKTEE